MNREGLLITSKLWNTKHNHGDVVSAAEQTLSDLGLNFLDLYLMHWPVLFKDGDINFPKDGDGNIIYADHDPCDTWKAMESLVDYGLVKAVGKNLFHGFLTDICKPGDIRNIWPFDQVVPLKPMYNCTLSPPEENGNVPSLLFLLGGGGCRVWLHIGLELLTGRLYYKPLGQRFFLDGA